MSKEWFDKAKEAALNAAESAKNVAQSAAESAKNANLGEMLDKTKNMALQAAEEAKKAAGAVLTKDATIEEAMGVSSEATKEELLKACAARIVKIEAALKDVKDQLAKLQ